VPLDANITLNFDEPVNVTGTWFQISCVSGTKTAVVSGGPISFTLNPDSDFTYNEACTVTVFASQVSDQDGDDPPHNMATDFVFSFNSEFLRDPGEQAVQDFLVDERYRNIVKVISQNLTECRAYKIGRINMPVYVVGRSKQGAWLGVSTRVVQT
jgi:hypothetical protein